jgi:hypothetical protein
MSSKYNGIYRSKNRNFRWSGIKPNGSYDFMEPESINDTFSIEYIKTDTYDSYRVTLNNKTLIGRISIGYDMSRYMDIIKVANLDEEEEVI